MKIWGEEGEDCDEDISIEEGEGSHKEGKENNNGDELSSYKSDDHCESQNKNDSEFEDYVMHGALSRHSSIFPNELEENVKLEKDGVTFQVKTYVSTNTCVRSGSIKEASAIWIASKIENVLRENPRMKARGVRNELKKFGVNPQYMQIYRAKKKTMEVIEDSHAESFKKLPYYSKMVSLENKGSVVTLQCDVDEDEIIPSTPVFKRFFLGLPALRDGFLEGCGPFMGFDGCHLKGPFGGVLLAAIGLDGNNGAALKRYFWQATRSYNAAGFNFFMYKIKELKLAAYDWLLKIPAGC
ncbi:UNVERIFIED_CONTAM: hypothetical protein Slati_2131800 [Sesamum latifolium]|uniref:Uncharacterized protein n=1 Tax=Sesamum latifolium TaxID=2727402 RepID=A0AAW2WTP3_9LAMI